jgi:tetratricopeptide (TPR) repeat protein
LCEFAGTPEYRVPQVDAAYNHAWASAFAAGDWSRADPDLMLAEVPQNPYFRPPGYGFFLGTVYAAFGSGPLPPRALQALLGVLTVALVGRIVWRLTGRAGPAAGCALLAACYRPFLYFETQLLDTALLVFLFALFLWFLVPAFGPPAGASSRRRLRAFFAAGLAAGATAVVRPNILLVLPFLALSAAAVAFLRERTAASRSGGRLARAVLPGLALALGTLLPVLPVTVRNARASGEFVLISANAGINLFIGNNPGSRGVFSSDLGLWGRYGNNADFHALYQRISRVTGYPVTYTEASRFLSREAVKWMRNNPAAALSNMARKALLVVGPQEVRLNSEVECAFARSRVLRLLPLRFSHLLALALAGLLVFRKRLPGATFYGNVWLVAGLYAASFLPFFVTGQYRTPLAVPLLVLAGCGLPAAAAAQVAAWAAAAGVCWAALSLTPCQEPANPAIWLTARAQALQTLGQTAEAARAYEECLAYARAQTDEPANVRAQTRAYAATAAAALGNAALRKADYQQALLRFEEAASYGPDDPEILSGLASACLLNSDAERAVALFRKALAFRPGDPKLVSNLRVAEDARKKGKQP